MVVGIIKILLVLVRLPEQLTSTIFQLLSVMPLQLKCKRQICRGHTYKGELWQLVSYWTTQVHDRILRQLKPQVMKPYSGMYLPLVGSVWDLQNVMTFLQLDLILVSTARMKLMHGLRVIAAD